MYLAGPVVSKSILDEIATELAPDAWLNPHRSIFGLGNYDVNVLLIALERQGMLDSSISTFSSSKQDTKPVILTREKPFKSSESQILKSSD